MSECQYPHLMRSTAYVYGCRCPECAAHMRAYYARKREQRRERDRRRRAMRAGERRLAYGPWRIRTTTNGYQRTSLPGHPLVRGKDSTVYVHRAVLFAMLGEGPHRCVICGRVVSWGYDLEVNHRDGDRTNNDPDNLEPICPHDNKLLRYGVRAAGPSNPTHVHACGG